MMRTRIFLLDDHTVLRQAVRVMLESEPDIEVVGDGGDAREGIDGIARTRPDVAIVDLKMPGVTGLSAIPELLKASATTSVLVFTRRCTPAPAATC